MVTTTVNRGDMYVTDGVLSNTVNPTTITTTGDQLVVHIVPTTKIDYNYDNQIISIPTPISRQKRGQEPINRNIDLKRIKEVITAQGFLADENRSDGVAKSAEGKRDDLLTLAKKRGDLTLVWGHKYSTNNYQTRFVPGVGSGGVHIMKMGFSSTVGKLGLDIGGATNQEPAERNIGVIITLMRGKDM